MGRLASPNTPRLAPCLAALPTGTAPDGSHGDAHRVGIARPLALLCASRQARLDAVFERLIRAFRAKWLSALATEAPGPARHVRAYVRSVCDCALQHSGAQELALQLLMQPCYQTIWHDFVAEACAQYTADHDPSQHCRAAVEGLVLCWAGAHSAAAFHGMASVQTLTPTTLAAERDRLLSVIDAAPAPAQASTAADAARGTE
ncbi:MULTISPECIES: hypothetical protein [unclassified Acidovorax]|uniref:hypothetical protein n=1 Tax=unclassified Acidovorax TaxID=2684926 RepID=UPI002882D81D|nr:MULTISPECIES: hypothetical protein [unclassified Acidovorax]